MPVLVFGSINIDLVVRTPRLPMAGETLIGRHMMTVPGGKGANQAVAIARLGVEVELVGRVGADSFGQELTQSLKAAGVGCDRLLTDLETESGMALIEVEDSGENHIVIIPGANGRVDASDVERLAQGFPQAGLLLLQLEVPLLAVQAAAEAAAAAGLTVILDPAPAHSDLPNDLLAATQILTPNQVEAATLVGFPVETLDAAEKAAIALQQRGANIVLVKLGRQGSVCVTPEETIYTPSFPVDAVDTVAAGDAFNGGLAAALAEGRPLREALLWATATAAIAVTRPGAQPAMPTRHELYEFFTAYQLTLH